MKKTKTKKISAAEFDRKFDAGEDVAEYLDFSNVRKINAEPKRVNVDIPSWMLHSLDREATKRGVTRQSLIKMWLAEKVGER